MTKLPTIKIKRKNKQGEIIDVADYVMVKDRVLSFNEIYTEGQILTEIIKNDEKSVVVKAIVYPNTKNKERYFMGHSEAYREGLLGNVPIEVAETSAVGRALAFMGIGIVESIASADEMLKAGIKKPETKNYSGLQKDAKFCDVCGENGVINPKTGKAFCPNWKRHQEEGKPWTLVVEDVKKFLDSMPEEGIGKGELKTKKVKHLE